MKSANPNLKKQGDTKNNFSTNRWSEKALKNLIGLGIVLFSTNSMALVSHEKADREAIEFCAKRSGPETPATWAQKMAQWGFSANIISFAKDMMGDKFGLFVKSRHEAKASSKLGLYIRKDKYTMGTRLIPWSDVLSEGENYELNTGINFSDELEVSYIRHFADPCLAELMPPYVDEEFPSDLKSFNKLKVNDVAIFKSPVRVSLGTGLLMDLGVNMPVSAGHSWTSQIQVTIHKIDNTRMHLNLSGLIDESNGVGSEYADGSSLKFTGIKFIDNQIKRLLDLKPWDISFAKGESQLFGVDYELDLSSPEVAAAFEETMKQYKLNLENIYKNTLMPWGAISEYSKNAQENIKDIEKLYLIEKQNMENARKVGLEYKPKIVRHVRGRLTDNYVRGGGKVGNKYLAVASLSLGCSDGKFSLVGEEEATEYFRLDSCRNDSSISLFREWISEKYKKQMLLISKSDQSFKTIDGLNLVFESSLEEDKRFTKYDYADLKRDLKLTLPEQVYAQIPFDEKWQQGGEIVNNVSANVAVVLNPDVVYTLPQMTKQQIKDSFRAYMNRLPTDYILSVRDTNKGDYNGNVEDYSFGNQIEAIVSHLAVALKNDPASMKNKLLLFPDRLKAFKEIVSIPLFDKIGLGYVLSLIPKNEITKNMNVFIKMNSTEATADNKKYKMDFELPGSMVQYDPVYIKIQSLNNMIQNQGEAMIGQSEAGAFANKDEIRKKEIELMKAALK